jgi:hypothetical protein
MAVMRTRRRKKARQTKAAAGGAGALGLAALATLLLLKRRRRRAAEAAVLLTQPPVAIDDVTLARKVESEIFRPADAPKGAVNVNAEFGVVFLRGEVPSKELVESLETAAREVDGVKDVRNLLKAANSGSGPADIA